MAQISGLLIGILMVVLVVSTFGILMSNGAPVYDKTYDNSTFQEYDQLTEITSLTNDIQNRTESVGAKSGVVDVLGSYFGDAYSAMKLTAKSFTLFGAISEQGFKDLGLPPYFKAVAITMMLIFIFIICLLAYFVGKPV